jgi:uncharacterized membrane protein
MKKNLNVLVIILMLISFSLMNYMKSELFIPKNVMTLFNSIFILIIAISLVSEVSKSLRGNKVLKKENLFKINQKVNTLIGVLAVLFFIVSQLISSSALVKWTASISVVAIAGIIYTSYFRPKRYNVDSGKLTWMPLYVAFCTFFVLLLFKLNGVSLF